MKAAKAFNVTLFDSASYVDPDVEEFQNSCYWTSSPSQVRGQVRLDLDYTKHASARSFCTNRSPFKLLLVQLLIFIVLPFLLCWALKSFLNKKKELKKKTKEKEKKEQQFKLENNDEKGLSILEEGILELETKECQTDKPIEIGTTVDCA